VRQALPAEADQHRPGPPLLSCRSLHGADPNYLELEYHENPGSAFGLLRSVPGARYILIVVGVIALILVWTMVRRVERWRTVANLAFALVAGGAIGNLLDRIYLGRVVDFVVMHWQRRFIWPPTTSPTRRWWWE